MSKLSDEIAFGQVLTGNPQYNALNAGLDRVQSCLAAAVWGYGSSEHSRTVVQQSETGVRNGHCWPIARVNCSSTASSWPAVRARSPRSTRPPKRCSVSPPMRAPTTWAARSRRPGARSTTPTGRRTSNCGCACIRQLQQALRDHVEELRELTIAEVGAPRMLTSMAQLEGPIEDLSFCADTAESYQWTTDFGVASPMGIKTQPHDRPGGRRRRRRHHAVELPASDQPRQDRPGAGGGQHRRPQACAGHPLVRGSTRRADPRAHRHPGGRRQHHHVQ